ncbi:MAG TPA: DUF3373 family protein, partial [Desulfurivibrionaceae bacterium]|nr:DUF3373 family protein [Desulfurivibrionaceae bacterium]
YTALNVARGVTDVLDSGQQGMPVLLGAFGLTMADPLANLMGGLPPTPDGFIAAATGVGLTDQQATDLAAIFYNPSVGGLLGPMAAGGATVGDVAASFGNVQSLVAFMKMIPAADRKAIFANLANQYQPAPATSYDNDTNYTNRFRLNFRAKAMENLEFKARLAMYKVWGMQNNAVDYEYNNGMGGGQFMLSSLAFDGSATRQPQDSVLRVDRAFMNWNAIGGSPVWFSIGRRPVTDGPPAHIRMGLDEKMATPVAYMDYPFDGLSLGYAYENLFGIQDAPGRVRFCYGRGFESGPTDNGNGLNDVDFGGISWDVFEKGNRFFNFQSFGAFNMFNVPDNVTFVNPIEFATWEDDNTQYNPLDSSMDLQLNRANLGDIFHTSAVYMSKFQNLNYFLTGGWSRTKARGMDELGTSLLGSWWEEPQDHDGYSVLLGVRYDLDSLGLKVGAEYNWGSEYWISFTPGHDDLYASKLATRGSVYELYTVYDIPAGEAISKFSKAFIRLGYQHYDYEYTGSGFWLGAPQKIDELANDPLSAQFYVPTDKMDQVYLTMEAWF